MSLEFVDRSSETNPKKCKFKEHIIGIRKTNDPDLWHVICGIGQLDQVSEIWFFAWPIPVQSFKS